ncbi:hypothetical protein [Litorimonas cladophorae]|nr:hypothetical protein [Litorimonas cladophorae]
MSQLQSFIGANDNSPAWVMRSHLPDRKKTAPRLQLLPSPKKERSFATGFMWLVPLAAFAAGLAAWWYRLPAENLVWPAASIGTILIGVAALSRSAWRIKNFSTLMAIGAFSTALFAAASQAGITLYATDISVIASATSITLAWVFKSRPALMLSGFSALVLLASLTPEISTGLGIGAPTSQGWLPLFPVLIGAQALLAMKVGSHGTLFVTIVAAYGYVVTIGSGLPPLPLAGFIFAVAAAHYRLGKAWADTAVFAARLHINIGWVMALGAAFYVQSHWLTADASHTETLWPANRMWMTAVGLAAFALFLSSIMRYKHSQITLTGIFLVSSSALVIPVASVRPDLLYFVFDAVPGLPARPGFGVLIGAVIIASGVAWVVNGIRKSEFFEMTLGALVIVMQVLILFNPNFMTMDFAIVFTLALICALCVSGLIAGTSLNHARPAKRYG